MKFKLILLLFTIFFGKINAQEISLDSLNKLAKTYVCVDVKKSDSLSNIVINKANSKTHLNQLGFAYKNLGTNLLCLRKLDESISFLLKSDSLFEKAKNIRDQSKLLNNLAVAYRIKGDFDKALYAGKKQLVIAEKIKSDTIKAYAYATISTVYSNKSLVDSTAIFAQKALVIAKDMNIEDLIWKMNLSLGIASQDNEDFEKALEYYLDLEPLLVKLNVPSNLTMLYNNMAGCYMGLKQLEKAKRSYEKNLQLSIESSNKHSELASYSGLAHVYSDMDKYQISNTFYLKTLALAEDMKIANIKIDAISNLTNNYYALGEFKKAIKYGEQAIVLAKEKGFLKKEIETYNYLFLIYKKTGNTTKALSSLEAHNKLEKERLEKEKSNTILELQTEYEVEKKELLAQNALKEKAIAIEKSKQNRNYFLGAICIAILILFSSVMFYGKYNARKKAELISLELKETQKRLALEKQYRHSELKALKAQMDPHFIFNALNSIQEYIILNQKNLASDYLGKFADLMRKYLNHSDKRLIPLNEEIDCLNMYLELEAIRFEDKLEYKLIIDENLNIEDIKIPTMLIQPYIENALKHGLLHKKEGGKVLILLNDFPEKQIVTCVVQDNGIGRKRAEELSLKRNLLHKSFASKATESRLNLLNYGRKTQIGILYEDLFDTDNLAIGTKVTISIPYSKA